MTTLKSALAALLLGAALVAQAAGLTEPQRALLKNGMTRPEVEAAVGRPYRIFPTGNTGRVTWVYALDGQSPKDGFVLDVEFNPEGFVISTKTRLVQDVF